MKAKLIWRLGTPVLLWTLSVVPNWAALLTLDFEGLVPGAKLGDFYNGGDGGDYGIAFYTSDKAPWADGGLSYPNAPSPTMVLRSTDVYSVTTCMNVAGGFFNEISFFYSAPVQTGRIEVWSGLDGTGSLLAQADLGTTDTSHATVYDAWQFVNISFPSTARSVQFGNNSGVAFDNFTIEAVPEPGSWVAIVFLVGVVALRCVRRLRH